MSDATAILGAIRDGDRSRFNELYSLVYGELHRLAKSQRAHWQGDYTLNSTALVHEAYLKLARGRATEFESRAHFLATAARAMRQVLMDYARSRQSLKRGSDSPRLSLERLLEAGSDPMSHIPEEERADQLAALDDLLIRLTDQYPRAARVVECRVFAGMQIEDIAEALGVTDRTVKRDWALAQAWLRRELETEGVD